MKVSDSKVLYRNLKGEMPVMVGGEDSWLIDYEGRKYLDLSSGPCTSSLGHSNEFVQKAIQNQLWKLPMAFGGFWASEASERAGSMLYSMFEDLAAGWFGRVIFQQGGGEAVDLACKLAVQYHCENDGNKYMIAARQHAFHGVGLLPFALSGRYPRYDKIRRYQLATENNYVFRIPHTVDRSWCDALTQTTELLRRAPWIAAVILEPMGGPSVGAATEQTGYLQGLRKLCDERDILLIFDEILCGSGRTGALSVAALHNVWPDIILLGKGLTGGYQPMSAIVINKKVADRIAKGSGSVMFGTTYSHHTLGCAAVSATLDYLRSHELINWVHLNGKKVGGTLMTWLINEAPVAEIRGDGYLWGVWLRDPVTNDPFPPSYGFHAKARQRIFEEGVIVYSKGQTIDGEEDFLIIAPPFEITDQELSIGVLGVQTGLRHAYDDYLRATKK